MLTHFIETTIVKIYLGGLLRAATPAGGFFLSLHANYKLNAVIFLLNSSQSLHSIISEHQFISSPMSCEIIITKRPLRAEQIDAFVKDLKMKQ